MSDEKKLPRPEGSDFKGKPVLTPDDPGDLLFIIGGTLSMLMEHEARGCEGGVGCLRIVAANLKQDLEMWLGEREVALVDVEALRFATQAIRPEETIH